MGLVAISPAKRFLDSTNPEDIYASTKLLLSGFLHVMQGKTVYFKYGMHHIMRDLAMRNLHRAGTERFGSGGTLLVSDDDEESTSGESRIVAESVDAAVETCATRLAKLPEIPRVSRGISFGIDSEPSGPDRSWSVVLHRGPLPLLQIERSSMSGFHPPSGWQDALINSHCAHVVQSTLGSGHNVLMLLKRTTLFPYSKGNSSPQSVAAGQQLRRLCREAWQQQSGSSETLYKASFWARRRRRFVREFDRMLLDRVGSEALSTILKQMDTRLESWLAADSLG
ncbi:MAG TPA: hypothetical protein VJP87_06540 [Candidatus Acidoferrales bacterium]|nr:hypothetical protein [Candidatus Acidoferrales bacterium]